MAFRKPKGKLPPGVKRGHEGSLPVARDSSHSVTSDGALVRHHVALEYREDGPSLKRVRLKTPSPEPITSSGIPYEEDSQAEVPDNAMGLPDPQEGQPSIQETPTSSPPRPPRKRENVEAEEASKKSSKKPPPSAVIQQWLPYEHEIIRALLSREADNLVSEEKECSRPDCKRVATIRCFECGAAAPMCEECTKVAHKHLYYHRPSRWTGDRFESIELGDLGFVIYLGHRDEPCHNIPQDKPPTNFVITHSNGVHKARIHYCHCTVDASGPKLPFLQLISSGLWPATISSPATAFSEPFMKMWHLDWTISHKSSQDYFRVFTRLTNNYDALRVSDRYRELMLASRMWRHFTMVKRSGRHHNIVLPHRDPKCLAVPCVACPSPDFNLPADWKTSTPKHLKYIYHIVLGVDGNHSLHKKSKRDDPRDVSLAPGQVFFIDHSIMADAVKEKYWQEEITITCSGFKVGRAQRPGKFRFLEVSGVVAVTCRHILFRPKAVVDMQRGETYLHGDFAMAGGLEGTEELEERVLTYDVICIYIRKILERFRKHHPELVPIIEELYCLLPSMHLHAHKELCQITYALAYAAGFGLAHGEGVETPWAEFNIAGLTTREMTAGARHDAINDLFNYWNWIKNEFLHKLLSRKLMEAYEAQKRTTKYFAGLTALAGPALVQEWLTLHFDGTAPTPKTFREKEAAWAESPFLVNHEKLPSASQAYEDLVEDVQSASIKTGDHTRKAIGALRAELGQFLMTGLELESELFDLRLRGEKRKAARGGELIDEKTLTDVTWPGWRKKADRWRADQAKYMPLLGVESAEATISEHDNAESDDDDDASDLDTDEDKIGSSSSTKPIDSTTAVARHDEVLGLPSDFSTEEIAKYDLQLLADYEARIRVGQAFDQLEVVRRAVMHLSAFVDAKKEHAHARKESTRANLTNRHSEVVRNDAARKYNAIYDRLVKLRPTLASSTLRSDPSDPASYLRRIDIPGDLTITSMKASREQGNRHRSGSWIWWAFEDVMSVVEATSDGTTKSARPNTRATGAGTTKGKARANQDAAMSEDGVAVDTKKYTTWFDRAQWFHAWQEKVRCDEAINILCADFRAAIRGFAALANRWLEASKRSNLDLGERTYAIERHYIFDFKSRQCQEAYDDVRQAGVPADRLDHTLALRADLEAQTSDMAQWEDVLTKLSIG